jgi:hypothetical protein
LADGVNLVHLPSISRVALPRHRQERGIERASIQPLNCDILPE